ncbi:unnamed protein product [Umbelopsis ramanniana]
MFVFVDDILIFSLVVVYNLFFVQYDIWDTLKNTTTGETLGQKLVTDKKFSRNFISQVRYITGQNQAHAFQRTFNAFLQHLHESELRGTSVFVFIDNIAAALWWDSVEDRVTTWKVHKGPVRASIEWKTKSVSARDKQRWDAKIKPLTLEIGDHVRMRKESKLGLEPNWLGPYVVVDRNLETHIYKLEHVLGEPYDSWIHVDRLRKMDPYSIDTPFYSPASTRANWVAENGLPPDEPYVPDTSMQPVPVPKPNMEDDIVDPPEVDRGRSTHWEGVLSQTLVVRIQP